MTRNALVAGFLVLVFAMALGLLFLEPEPLPGALDPDARPGTEAPEGGRLDGGDGAFDTAPEVVRQPGEEEGLAGAAEGGQPAGETIVVQVVAAESGEPVAGAVVRMLDVPVPESAAAKAARFAAPGLHGLLADAPTWRTGSDGLAHLPRPDGVLVADASHGDRYGQVLVDVDRPVERVTLTVAADVAVRARVVDPRGQPVAGVPVALQTRAPRWSRNDMTLVTDGDGRVRFPHAQVALGRSGNGEDWVAVVLPGMPDAAAKLAPSEEELEKERLLRISDTGSVTVRVLDHAGQEDPRPLEVMLRGVAEPDAPQRTRFAPDHEVARATAVDGLARFPRVGIGGGVLAAARLDASDEWFTVTGEGPQAPGEEVELVLRRDTLRPEVRFRLLTPEGTPLAGAEVSVTERGRTTRSMSERTRSSTTDGEGMLVYAPRQGPLAPLEARWLELRWHASRAQGPWTGRQELSFDVPPGTSDLGGVTMEPPHLLAAGVVTGPAGEPVGNARVRLYVRGEDSRPGRVRWRMHPGGETQSGADGSFAIAGMPSGTEIQLRATHPRYLQGTVPGVEGAPDHRIVLGAGHVLAGRVRVDDPAMHDHLAVAFVADGNGDQGNRNWFRGGRREDVEPEGTFDFGAMSDQRGTVQVLDKRSGLVLHEIPGVAPWPADGPADGRLDPLDLRGQVDLVALRFVDMQRQPVRDVRFSIMLPGEDESWWSRARDGNAELFAPPGGLDMLVRTDGYRHVMLRGVSGEREVVLEPAIPLRFDLQPSALASEFELEVRVRRVENGPEVDPSSIRLDAAGRAEATASGPGTVHVYLRVRYRDAEGRRTSRYVDFDGLGRRLVHEVRDSVGVQAIPLRVSRDAVLRAMDAQ